MPNTQFKVYHSSPLHTYKVQIHIHYRYIESIAFRYIPKHTRDPITQTVHFFTSAYLYYVKSPCKHSPCPLLHTAPLHYTSSNSNSGTTFFSTISCLFILIHIISLPHQTCKKSYQTFHLLAYSYLQYLKSSCKHSPYPLLFHGPLLPTAPLHYKTYTSSNSNSGTTFFSLSK